MKKRQIIITPPPKNRKNLRFKIDILCQLRKCYHNNFAYNSYVNSITNSIRFSTVAVQ